MLFLVEVYLCDSKPSHIHLTVGQCDEAYPTCGSCQRSGVSCSLSEASLTPSTPSHVDESHKGLNVDDLRLLYHWMVGDDNMFSDHDAWDSKKERDRQTELSLSHTYLLHTLLSISALELFDRNPQDKSHYEQASAHHLAALHHAQSNVIRTDEPQHSEPAFLFSAFTSLYAFAEPPLRMLSPGNKATFSALDDLLQAFNMGRGIVTVASAHSEHLKATIEQQNFRWPDETSEFVSTLETDYPELRQLLDLIATQQHYSNDQIMALNGATKQLFAIIALLEHREKTHSSARQIQTWPMHVDASLTTLWEARDAVSVLLLAYYAAAMSMRSNLWFFKRWPPLILEEVVQVLAPQAKIWEKYLAWPRRTAFCNNEAMAHT